MAAIDVSGLVSGIAEQAGPIASVAGAVLLVYVALVGFRKVKEALLGAGPGGGGDYIEDASLEDDEFADTEFVQDAGDFIISCAHCSAEFVAGEHLDGDHVRCPECGKLDTDASDWEEWAMDPGHDPAGEPAHG